MKRIRLFICLLGTLLVYSCGLLELDEDVRANASLHFDRDTIYCMAGEQFSLKPVVEPDTLADKSVFLMLSNDSVLTADNGILTCEQEGWVTVTAYHMLSMAMDSCHVFVIQPWNVDEFSYPYETVVYAQVTVDGKPFDPSTMRLAAYIDDQVRGLATVHDAHGITYVQLRVGSYYFDYDDPYSGEIEFYLYQPQELMLRKSDVVIEFDGQTHGTLSSLMKLNF